MFTGWTNFFYMVGSAGGGLIGLLFVVVTLTAGAAERPQAMHGAKVYLTPTALHFAAVLAISAVAMAPGLPVPATAGLFGFIALVGLFHAARSCMAMATSRVNTAHWSDLWMYGIGPATIYVCLIASAVAVAGRLPWSVHALAALLLILLLTAVRNAWDLITWMAPKRSSRSGAVGEDFRENAGGLRDATQGRIVGESAELIREDREQR